MKNSFILHSLTEEEFRQLVTKIVVTAFKQNLQTEQLPVPYLTRQELASKFKVSLSTIHNWVKQGKLKSYKAGGRNVRFKSEEVEALLQENPRYKHSFNIR